VSRSIDILRGARFRSPPPATAAAPAARANHEEAPDLRGGAKNEWEVPHGGGAHRPEPQYRNRLTRAIDALQSSRVPRGDHLQRRHRSYCNAGQDEAPDQRGGTKDNRKSGKAALDCGDCPKF
jgi:hypothetical protein